MIKSLIAVLLTTATLMPQGLPSTIDDTANLIDPIVTGGKLSAEQYAAWQARRDAFVKDGSAYQDFPQ